MIWYIIEAFKNECRITDFDWRKLAKKNWKYSIILIVVAFFYFISTIISLKYKVYWLWIVFFIIIVVALIYFVRCVSREAEKQYEENVQKYKNRLMILRDILNREVFKLYSEKKVARLIEDCDRILPELKNSHKIFKPILTTFTILFPLIVSFFGAWMDTVSSYIAFQVVALFILIIMYLLGIFYIIKPVTKDLLDRNYIIVKDLRDMLSDIILIDFID